MSTIRTWRINNADVPVKIVYENRRNARFSLTSSSFVIRIPRFATAQTKSEMKESGKRWIESTISRKPDLLNLFAQRIYRDGDCICTFDREIEVTVNRGASQNGLSLSLKSNILAINTGQPDVKELEGEGVSKTVQKAFAKIYNMLVTKRAQDLAEEKELPTFEKLRLTYMSSRWGSCSSKKGNLSINTKLLLAPAEVLDSVIIHELGHLVYADHSKNFWKLIDEKDPYHRRHSNWLKTNGTRLQL
ncbi:MAG: M48 family peptidase [Saprospirales bacterium]|nr:MAG: M48 family peptidase [Saprospirales bacterium]